MSCLQFALLPRGWLNRYCSLSMRLAYNDLVFEEETVSLQMSLSVALNKLGVLKQKKNIFHLSLFPPVYHIIYYIYLTEMRSLLS